MYIIGNNASISLSRIDFNAISYILIIEIELIGNSFKSISIIQQEGETTKCIQI